MFSPADSLLWGQVVPDAEVRQNSWFPVKVFGKNNELCRMLWKPFSENRALGLNRSLKLFYHCHHLLAAHKLRNDFCTGNSKTSHQSKATLTEVLKRLRGDL